MISLSSIVYFVSDINSVKIWIEDLLEIKPYQDESSFVGFKLKNQEKLCLHKIDAKCNDMVGNQVCYWEVTDMDAMGATIYRSPLELKEGGKVCQIKSPFNFVIGLKQSS